MLLTNTGTNTIYEALNNILILGKIIVKYF